MDQEALIADIVRRLQDNVHLSGLFLGGSHGRGTADQWSDIDFIAVAAPDAHAAMAADWRAALESITPIVFWNQIDGAGIVLNAITADWQRIDLSIQDASNFTARRARNLVRSLIDRGSLYQALTPSLPDKTPDPKALRYIIHEFIRVIGLTPIVLGRGEYVSAVWGTGLLRNLFIDLLQQQYVTMPDPGGALHLSRLLPADKMAALAALPYPGPKRDELIAAQSALAKAFFPAARQLAEQVQLDWPSDFETATRRHLDATLGPDAIAW